MKTTSIFYRELPKVDLHRHLEGSLRVDTLLDIARLHGITLPLAPGLRALVQMQPEDPFNFSTFLSKFQTLRLFYRSPEVITRITREAIEDASRDGLLTWNCAYTSCTQPAGRFPNKRGTGLACTGCTAGIADFSPPTSLIVSVNRHEPVETAPACCSLPRIIKTAVSLVWTPAGNEVEFAAPFRPYRDARAEGLFTTVHAGTRKRRKIVREAIEDFEVNPVSHVRVMEDPTIVSLARERQTVLRFASPAITRRESLPALTNHPSTAC